MKRISLLMSFCLLVACNNGDEQADKPDASQPDGPVADTIVTADGQATPDSQATADSLVEDATPADVAPPALAAQIVQAYVWANLMPAVPPDPTYATMSIELSNSGSTDITGVTLTDAALVVSADSYIHPLTMEPIQSFSGVIEAGQTLTVEFQNQPSSTTTPLPCDCGEMIKLRTKVAWDGGQIPPVWSGEITFDCTY